MICEHVVGKNMVRQEVLKVPGDRADEGI